MKFEKLIKKLLLNKALLNEIVSKFAIITDIYQLIIIIYFSQPLKSMR